MPSPPTPWAELIQPQAVPAQAQILAQTLVIGAHWRP